MVRGSIWLVALALALVCGAPPAARAEGGIGKLDGEKVFKEYKLYQKLNDELQAMGRTLIQEFSERKQKHPLLVDEEWNRLLTLRKKAANASPAEKQEYDRLSQLSFERDKDLADLEAAAKLDDKQQAKLKELSAYRAQAKQMMDDQWERIQKQGAERSKEIEQRLTAEIREAVKKIAQQKGLAVVMQADVVIFGGEDITEATLALLNAAAEAKPDKPAGR